MFQTEPVLFLQAFSSAWVTRVAILVNALGYAQIQLPCVLIVVFGINLRRGFLLMQAMLWNAALTNFLKGAFGLPRPADVDDAVRLLPEGVPAQHLYAGRGATGFFSLPPADVVDHYRSVRGYSYGPPSGHVSSIMTLWGTIAALFRRGSLVTLAATLVILTGATRVYLGRHFPGDVLAGAVVGLLPVLVVWRLVTMDRTAAGALLRSAWPRTVWLLFAPWILLWVPGVELGVPAQLFGLGAAYLLLRARGLPIEGGTLGQRAARLALAALVLAIALKGLAPLLRDWLGGGWAGRAIPDFATAFVLLFVVAEASLLLRLYPGREPVSPEAAAG
jgi:membrane-associated phospholipid phosphatase